MGTVGFPQLLTGGYWVWEGLNPAYTNIIVSSVSSMRRWKRHN
jgi:hypothetical protein